MKAALYARVSTFDQEPESQLTALRRYCEARNWKVFREYVDQVSGAIPTRPEMDALMADAAAHKFDGVLVWKFDRLFRSVEHMMGALDRFRTLGVDFVSVTECIDTSTPMGKMIFTLLAAIAEFERSLAIERTKIGMERARAQGKRIGRPQTNIDVQEVARLWNHGEGLSYRKIAEKLTAEGVKVSAAKIWTLLQDSVLKHAETISERHGTQIGDK